MAVTHVATATTQAASTTSSNLNIPAHEADDLLLVAFWRGGSGSTSLPAEWTKAATADDLDIFWKVAQTSSGATTVLATTSSSRAHTAACSVWRGVSTSAPIDAIVGDYGTSTDPQAPAITASSPAPTRLAAVGQSGPNLPATPSGWSARARFKNPYADRVLGFWSRDTYSGSAQTFSTGTFAAYGAISIALRAGNQAPNAPILTAPADASTIDRTATQRFDWDFSDPDAGDTQSAYNLRYRVVGAATWTETGWVSTPNTYRDIPGGTFADATDYEWQVATKDAQGVEGPYSSSSFFTAANAPGGPTITTPVSGGTVEQFQTVEWSTPNQDAYQIQVLDGMSVVYDSGTVVSSTARSAVVEFPDNDVARTLQIQVLDGGLWSPWTAISVSVSYTPPPTPSLVAAASSADGAVSVTATTPAAGAGEPTVEYVDLYVRDTTGQDKYRPAVGIRLAAQQLPNGVVIDWIAASGDNYEYQAVAVGDNGTTSASAWTAIDPDAEPTIYYGGDY